LARNLDPKCRQCRREGEKLFLKLRSALLKNVQLKKEIILLVNTDREDHLDFQTYGVQLREKQKLRRIYGVLEKQFRSYYAEADRKKGITGENLLQMLESRLDNVAYKMGLGGSRTEARQIVRHNSILVNGKRVNIPSYQVQPGDSISVADQSKDQLRIKSALEAADERGLPEWLEVDVKKLTGIFKNRPERDDLPSTINESLVVELYSK
jgi:small subunit ribosomal protein S4